MIAVVIVCPRGAFMTTVAPSYVEKALSRDEIVATDRPNRFRVVDRPLVDSRTPAQKHRDFVASQKK